MVEQPIHLSSKSEPQPDICIISGTFDDYDTRHPSADEVRLVVEIADSSEDRDTNEKMFLYAEAGIREYWVSLLNKREVVVYRQPTLEGYANVQVLREGDTVTPLFAPDVPVSITELLPP